MGVGRVGEFKGQSTKQVKRGGWRFDNRLMTEVLALIPARGGSKSIPRKNIRDFAGFPLIAYSIAAGLAAESVGRLIVSTDDHEIAKVSRSYGAETPFIRPLEFSQDNTPDLPVFRHALEWLAKHEGYVPDIVVQLRPTSPLRRVAHIDEAVYRLIERPEADAIRTVCIPFQNPFKMWRIGPDGLMNPIGIDLGVSHEPYNQPRQVLPEIYWQTGYVDAAWADTILTKNSMTGDVILPLIIDPSDWVDIDSPGDWRRAEMLIESGEVVLEDLGFQLE
jgi:CMP-N-acetylneuraminic acid synthetase